MSIRQYISFYQHETDIIISALQFTANRVIEYYEDAIKKMGESHRKVITTKREEIVKEINNVISFLQKNPDANIFVINPTTWSIMSNVMRSALTIYARELSKVTEELELDEYNNQKK